MSVRARDWAWSQRAAKGNRKLVLLALAEHANDEGLCWPGQSTLATMCGISPRCVGQHLAGLEAADLLTRERRHRPNGSRSSDLYRLFLPADPAGDSPTKAKLSRNQGAESGADKAQLSRPLNRQGEPPGEPTGGNPSNVQELHPDRSKRSRDPSRFDRVVRR